MAKLYVILLVALVTITVGFNAQAEVRWYDGAASSYIDDDNWSTDNSGNPILFPGTDNTLYLYESAITAYFEGTGGGSTGGVMTFKDSLSNYNLNLIVSAGTLQGGGMTVGPLTGEADATMLMEGTSALRLAYNGTYATGRLTIGGGNGAVEVKDSALITADRGVYVGYYTTLDSVCTLAINGGSVTTTDGIYLGNGDGSTAFSRGIVTQTAGTVQSGWTFQVGVAVGSEGTYDLSGGVILAGTQDFSVGRAGSGRFIMTGGTVLGISPYIGYSANSAGYMSMSAGSCYFSGDLRMGNAAGAVGTLDISGTIAGTKFDLGAGLRPGGGNATGSAVINMSGGTMTACINVGQETLVAQNGTATFNLSGGAFTQVRNTFYLGYNATGKGTVNVSGDASFDMTAGNVIVGGNGSGVFTVAGTATAKAARIDIPSTWGAGAKGLVTVSGGLLRTNTEIYLAYNDAGTLDISGGSVSSTYLNVGAAAPGTGTVNVSGSGEYVARDGGYFPIRLGGAGKGYLFQTGGLVSAGNHKIIIGEQSGSVGVYNISAGQTRYYYSMDVGQGGGNGTLNVSGTGLVFGTGGGIQFGIGAGGRGTLNMTGGSIDVAGNIMFANNATAVGVANIDGGKLEGAVHMYIGHSGKGTITMSDGLISVNPHAAWGQLNLGGVGASAKATLIMTGGTIDNCGGGLNLSAPDTPNTASEGTLTMSNNAHINVGGGNIYSRRGTEVVSLAGNANITTTQQFMPGFDDLSPSVSVTLSGNSSINAGFSSIGYENGNAGMPRTVTLNDNARLTVSSIALGVEASSGGTLVLNGGTVTTSSSYASFQTAPSTGCVAVINVAGGTIDCGNIVSLSHGASANTSVTMSSGLIKAGQDVEVGYTGSATVNMSGGKIIPVLSLRIGRAATATGILTQTGGAVEAPWVQVGYWGNATYAIGGGSAPSLTTGNIQVGVNDTSIGTFNVSAGAAVHAVAAGTVSDGGMIVGFQGDGVSTVSGGSLTVDGTLVVANFGVRAYSAGPPIILAADASIGKLKVVGNAAVIQCGAFNTGAGTATLACEISASGISQIQSAGIANFGVDSFFDVTFSTTPAGGSEWVVLQASQITNSAYLVANNAGYIAGNWDFEFRDSDADTDLDQLVVTTPSTVVLGDFDGNGVLNNLDIPDFKSAIANKAAWESLTGRDADVIGDYNGDGVFNNLDIPGFKADLAS